MRIDLWLAVGSLQISFFLLFLNVINHTNGQIHTRFAHLFYLESHRMTKTCLFLWFVGFPKFIFFFSQYSTQFENISLLIFDCSISNGFPSKMSIVSGLFCVHFNLLWLRYWYFQNIDYGDDCMRAYEFMGILLIVLIGIQRHHRAESFMSIWSMETFNECDSSTVVNRWKLNNRKTKHFIGYKNKSAMKFTFIKINSPNNWVYI